MVLDNEVSGHVKAGVIIYGSGTAPTLLRNILHSNLSMGVYVYEVETG